VESVRVGAYGTTRSFEHEKCLEAPGKPFNHNRPSGVCVPEIKMDATYLFFGVSLPQSLSKNAAVLVFE
jgi:hypothetical protein